MSTTAKASRIKRHQGVAHPWWFTVPVIVVFGVFFLTPNLLNFVYPFTNWSAFRPNIDFVGTKNFETILHDGSLQKALVITLEFAALTTLISNTAGLGLAFLLERDSRFNRFARAVLFLPVLISTLAVGYIFQALLSTDGALNQLLSAIAGTHVRVPWLGNTTWTVLVVAVVNSWKWVGMNMLIYIAGLKTIPGDILEAARVDGAGAWRMFWNIRFPLLAPAVTFNVATALIGGMTAFDVVLATTQGGPAGSTEVFNAYVFRIFGQGLYAQATAVSLVLFGVVVVLAVPLVTYLRRRERAMS